MDKYEYNLKLDQIKALSAEEGYMSAAEIDRKSTRLNSSHLL